MSIASNLTNLLVNRWYVLVLILGLTWSAFLLRSRARLNEREVEIEPTPTPHTPTKLTQDLPKLECPKCQCPTCEKQECPKVPEPKCDTKAETKGETQQTGEKKRILVNFAHNCCKRSQPRNCKTGLDVGGFTECRSYQMGDIDPFFFKQNKHILTQSRGGGYWLWKPYFLYKVLEESNPGDIIFYADSGSYFTQSTMSLQNEAEDHDVVVFDMPGLTEKHWCKRDTFILLGLDETKYHDSAQTLAAFLIIKNSWKSKLFVSQWLTYAQDERVITDKPNTLGQPNFEGFRDHRHDQSVLGLLVRKWGIHVTLDKMANYIEHNRDKS